MSNLTLRVDDDLVVSLEYVLKLDDGQEVDRSDSDDPLQYLQGHGQIIPGLESSLYGMAAGEEKDVVVSPVDAYGERDPENIEVMPRNRFPEDMALSVGANLQLRDQQSGELYEAIVTELIGDEQVVLDFNHPLAGETLYFHVKVSGLRPATVEELSHGHVHDGHVH